MLDLNKKTNISIPGVKTEDRRSKIHVYIFESSDYTTLQTLIYRRVGYGKKFNG